MNAPVRPPATRPAETRAGQPYIMALGFRGFPHVQGGIEAHACNLYPLLVALGCRVEALVRTPYVPARAPGHYQGVTLTRLWCPRSRSLETLLHTFIGVLYAALRRPDLLHIHAVGPGLFVPLARLLGLRVVMTHHGLDYERQKWGPVARRVLGAGESLGVRWANACITVSRAVAKSVRERHGVEAAAIPNGVHPPRMPEGRSCLQALELQPGRYVLSVARFVPEKRQPDLIRAFAGADLPGWKLVLAGDADHPDAYSAQVRALAGADPRVVLAGFRSGEDLAQLFANAGCFVLPSSHEGFPIAALEALSYGLTVIASDIPANRELQLPSARYFPTGDIGALRARLEAVDRHPQPPGAAEALRRRAVAQWGWGEIARSTLAVMQNVLADQEKGVRFNLRR